MIEQYRKLDIQEQPKAEAVAQPVQPEELDIIREVTPLEKATNVTMLCEDLDASLRTEEGIRIDDPRLSELQGQLRDHAGSPGLTNYVNSYDFLRHTEGANTFSFSSFSSLLGVDLETGEAGVFDPEGAKKFEIRQLTVFGPAAVRGAISAGFIGEADRIKARYQNWAQDFEDHYGKSLHDPENLSKVFPSNHIQEKWLKKNIYNS